MNPIRWIEIIGGLLSGDLSRDLEALRPHGLSLTFVKALYGDGYSIDKLHDGVATIFERR